jgi:hypothetical protein
MDYEPVYQLQVFLQASAISAFLKIVPLRRPSHSLRLTQSGLPSPGIACASVVVPIGAATFKRFD